MSVAGLSVSGRASPCRAGATVSARARPCQWRGVRVSGGRRGYGLLVPSSMRGGSLVTVPSFQDLPLADRDREWDGAAAEKRVRGWAGAEDGPNAKYRDAHVWYDEAKPDNFGSYKLLVADVVDGRLKAVPRG